MNTETNILTKGNNPKIILVVIILFSIHFWELSIIPQKVNAENLVAWVFCGFCFLMVSQWSNLRFKYPIVLFFIGIVINMVQAYINLGQTLYDSMFAFAFFYFILIYFVLHYLNITIDFLEKVILAFAIIFSSIYIIQAIIYPYQIVSIGLNTDRGSYQFEIVGHGFLMLAYFMVLNRYLINGKFFNILLAVIFFYVLFMGGFRTFLAGALFVTVIMFMRKLKLNRQNLGMMVIAVMLFMTLFQIPGFTKKIDEFVGETQKQLSQIDKIDRVITTDFFFNKYPQNASYYIFGGGLPGGDNLDRYYNTGYFQQNQNIVYVDIGLIGFYIVIGAVALAGLLWWVFKAVFVKLPPDKIYINFYFLYLILVSLTTYEIYRPGIFTVQAIALYLIDKSLDKKAASEQDNSTEKKYSVESDDQ
jgi:hypothetical protein